MTGDQGASSRSLFHSFADLLRDGSANTRRRLNVAGPPIEAVDGCIITGQDGHKWAWFYIPAAALWDLKPVAEKEEVWRGLCSVLNKLVGYEIHFLTIPGDLDADYLGRRWLDPKWSDLNPAPEMLFDDDDVEGIRAYEERIIQNVAALKHKGYKVRAVHLGIRLRESTAARAVSPDQSELDIFGIKARKNYRLLPELRNLLQMIRWNGFAARPVPQDRLLDLVTRMIWPGHPNRPQVVLSNHQPGSAAQGEGLAYLQEGDVLERYRSLIVDPDEIRGRTYAAYWSLHSLPQDPVFPGNEFLRLVVFGQPVMTSVRARIVSASRMDSKVRRVKDDLVGHSEWLAINNKGDGQNELVPYAQALEAFARHTEARQPTVVFSATAILTNPDEDILHDMGLQLELNAAGPEKGGYDDQSVGWVAPGGSQLALYREAMPGSTTRCDRYAHYASVESFAVGMPVATSQLPFLGTLIGELTAPGCEAGPLFMRTDVSLLPDVDKRAAILLVGPSGGGKTLAGSLLGVSLAMRGGVAIIRDPKGDTRYLDVPRGLRFQQIDLGEFEGAMNPGLLQADPVESANLMARMLQTFASAYDADSYGALFSACQAEILRDPERPDFRMVIQALARGQSEVERRIGSRLSPYADMRWAKTFTGSRTDVRKLLDALGPGLTTWGAEGWEPPPPSIPEGQWTVGQHATMALLELQFGIGRLVSFDRRRVTYTFDDEFHMYPNALARSLYLVARFARSVNAITAVGTQSWDDVPENIMDLVGLLVVFKQESRKEAARSAAALGLDPDDESVIRMLMSLGSGNTPGEAVFRHPLGRAIQGRFDPTLWTGASGQFLTNQNARRLAEETS
ncbi:MAG TPA: ATP-binding protein [Candidatus Saccharimonadia bacterium]|jgi:hypothetical protein